MRLIDETVPPFEPRDLRRSAAVLAVGMFLANAVIAVVFAARPPNLGYRLIRTKWQLIETDQSRVDWIFVGDSSCNQALDPDVFEETTGLSAVNLCTTGDMLVVGDVWYLRHYVDRHGPPRAGILVTHVYDVWPRDDTSVRGVAWTVPAPDNWRTSRTPLPADARERVTAAIGDFVPLYAQPASAWRLVTAPSEMLRAGPRISDRGFMYAGEARPAAVQLDADEHQGSRQPVAVSAVNRQAVELLVGMAAEANVPLVLSPSPLVDTLWSDPAFQTRFAQATAITREVATAHDHVRLLSERPWIYRTDELQNADHVAQPVAPRHTRAVVDALRDAGLIRAE